MGSGTDRLATQRRRAGRAAMAVAVLMVAVLAACLLGGRAQGSGQQRAFTGAVWEALGRGQPLAAALSGAGIAEGAADQAPDWFASEVADVRDGWRVLATEGWQVVSIGCDGSLDSLRSDLEQQLAARGWTRCPTGMEGQDTYLKDGGTCRWMMVGFSGTDGAADAVLRIHAR